MASEVNSHLRTQTLYSELAFEGVRVDTIHGGRSKAQRESVVAAFRAGRTWLLITTDLMGRGIDFKGVRCVVNYDLPENAIDYVRIATALAQPRFNRPLTHATITCNYDRCIEWAEPDGQVGVARPSHSFRKTNVWRYAR